MVAARREEFAVVLRETSEEYSKRLPFTMKSAVEPRRNVCCRGADFLPRGSSCGSSSEATSSREDSDSDCVCDVESSNQEDSGLFSADFNESIIAPPSPFVTRNVSKETPAAPPRSLHQLQIFESRRIRQDVDSCCEGIKKGKPLHSTTIYIDGPSQDDLKWKAKERKKSVLPSSEVGRNLTVGFPSINENTSQRPTAHAAANAPICKSCVKNEVSFFNPNCELCWTFFKREGATPSHVFAVLRLWIPEVQKCISQLIRMALLLGCGVQDRDAVTDMTLLHYAVKAGANGIGDPLSALQVVSNLINQGADLHQRCKWTSMTALHYAAYFDVPNALALILKSPDGVSVDDPCLEYNNGTPLHIAAANLSVGAAKVLLKHGASPWCKDNLGRTPEDCIPSSEQFELVPDLQEVIARMQKFFRREWKTGVDSSESCGGTSYGVSGRAILRAVGLKIGDRVLVSGLKTAILRYAGPTEFATGLWAGVELETPQGRHNGTVKGVVYFRCAKNYGLFVPINRLTKIPNVSPGSFAGRERRRIRVAPVQKEKEDSLDRRYSAVERRSLSLPPKRVNHGRVDVSKVGSKVAQDIRNSERKIVIGDRVCVDVVVDANVFGVVRYTGGVHFASGYWIGVELDEARGSHDGSVCGTRYFACRRQHGIFAASSRVTKLNSGSNHHWSLTASRQRTRSSSIVSKLPSNQMSTSLTDSLTSSSSSSSNPYLLGEDDIMPLALPGIGHLQKTVKTAFYPTNTSMSNLNRCFSARYISSRKRQDEIQQRKERESREPRWEELPPMADIIINKRQRKENPHWLQIGHNVFYRNKVGIVRYIGRVHFAEGTWLGVELREKRGRHDGTVEGRRYFSCRKNYGVMVPPNKVTVHGLNGALLVKQDEENAVHFSCNELSIL